ncbi:MAG: phytanoyl-CoA dioxygenase family protein [Pseudonocardiales bacterium]|nr:phytanoyl-CoA dioxygenase family protein [Pseudonocardiales bacterium]
MAMTAGSTQKPDPTAEIDLDAFVRDGFVGVPNFLSGAGLEQLRTWVCEIEAWPPGEGTWFQHDELGERGVVRTRTENFSPHHAGLRQMLTTGALPQMAGRLLGEPAVLYKEKVNYKYPGGAGFAPHQDAPAYPQVPVTVSCLLAVDDATTENGCLELVAGRHHALLPTNGEGCIPADVAERLSWVAMPVPAGSLLWFHGHTPHRSGPNRSPHPRRALYLTYNAAALGDLREAYYAHKRATFAKMSAANAGRISLIGHFQGTTPPGDA